MKTTPAGDLRVLARGLAVLECFAGGPSLSLTDVVAATGLPVSTAWRFLQALHVLGYLTRSGARRYQASAKTWALTRGSLGHLATLNPYPRLGALAAETGIGWVMHVLDGLETVIVAFGFAHPIQMDTPPMGQRMPALSSAFGLAIAACLRPAELQPLLDSVAGEDHPRLQVLLERAAAEGLACFDNPPLSSLAAPIFNFNRAPLASVGVVAYSAGIDSQRLSARWGKRVRAVARELSEELGYAGGDVIEPRTTVIRYTSGL